MSVVKELAALRNLTSLSLAETPLTDASVKELATAPSGNSLT